MWANRWFAEKWQRKRGKPPSKRNLPFIMHASLPESTVLRHYGKGAKTMKQRSIPGGFRVTECMFRLIFHYSTFIFVIYYYAPAQNCKFCGTEPNIYECGTWYVLIWESNICHIPVWLNAIHNPELVITAKSNFIISLTLFLIWHGMKSKCAVPTEHRFV